MLSAFRKCQTSYYYIFETTALGSDTIQPESLNDTVLHFILSDMVMDIPAVSRPRKGELHLFRCAHAHEAEAFRQGNLSCFDQLKTCLR